MIARGPWKDTLQKNGLCIHHHIQKKDTDDHPHVLEKPDDQPYPARPVGDEKSLEPGLANTLIKVIIYWMSRTRIGALCTTEHCRHAPGEMEDLDKAFQKLRAEKPDYPMPYFDRLQREMPSWDKIGSIYGR